MPLTVAQLALPTSCEYRLESLLFYFPTSSPLMFLQRQQTMAPVPAWDTQMEFWAPGPAHCPVTWGVN